MQHVLQAVMPRRKTKESTPLRMLEVGLGLIPTMVMAVTTILHEYTTQREPLRVTIPTSINNTGLKLGQYVPMDILITQVSEFKIGKISFRHPVTYTPIAW